MCIRDRRISRQKLGEAGRDFIARFPYCIETQMCSNLKQRGCLRMQKRPGKLPERVKPFEFYLRILIPPIKGRGFISHLAAWTIPMMENARNAMLKIQLTIVITAMRPSE